MTSIHKKHLLKFLIHATKHKKLIEITLKHNPTASRFVEAYSFIKKLELNQNFKLSKNRYFLFYQIGGFHESYPPYGWKIFNLDEILNAQPVSFHKYEKKL